MPKIKHKLIIACWYIIIGIITIVILKTLSTLGSFPTIGAVLIATWIYAGLLGLDYLKKQNAKNKTLRLGHS